MTKQQWDEDTAKKAQDFAMGVIEQNTETLASIEDTVAKRTLENIHEIRSWQKALITLIFAVIGTLVPVFYTHHELPPNHWNFYLGLALLTTDGIYLADKIKRNLERDLRDLPNAFNDLKSLIRRTSEAARDVVKEPTYENFTAYQELSLKIPEESTQKLRDVNAKNRVNFTNDFGLGGFVVGIYLLLGGVLQLTLAYWFILIFISGYFIVRAAIDWRDLKISIKKRIDDTEDLARHVNS